MYENLRKRKFWVFSLLSREKFMHKNPLFLPSFGQKFIVIFADFLLKIFNKAKTAKKKYQQSANQQSDNRAHRHLLLLISRTAYLSDHNLQLLLTSTSQVKWMFSHCRRTAARTNNLGEFCLGLTRLSTPCF